MVGYCCVVESVGLYCVVVYYCDVVGVLVVCEGVVGFCYCAGGVWVLLDVGVVLSFLGLCLHMISALFLYISQHQTHYLTNTHIIQ